MRLIAQTATVWLNAGLGFFYPEACQLCGNGRATPRQGFVCADCWRKVRFIRGPFCECCGRPFEGRITTPFECGSCRASERHFRYARSAVVADDLVLDVVHRYKYRRALWFEPFLADLLLRQAVPELAKEKWDGIVPVPLHFTKEREREFNQAERLAAWLSGAAKIPINKTLLQRVVPTKTQTRLDRRERVANVANAFALRHPGSLAGERLVLLDDVFTTGATTNACAKVLRGAGAGDVCVWTVVT